MKPAWLALVVIAAACGGAQPFPHRAHVTRERCGAPGELPCATCASCHEPSHADVTGRPGAEICRRCHTADDVRTAGWQAPVFDRAPVRFTHGRHLGLPELRGQCMKCHPGIADDARDGAVFPEMASCLGSCHGSEMARGECRGCHGAADLASLVPRTFLRHDIDFVRDHGVLAAAEERVCTQCHTARDCSNCHDASQTLPFAARVPDAIDRELVHRADFLTRHPIEARSQPATCARCHESSSCEGCHLERGVSANALGGRSPHPSGWIGPNTLAASFHGRQARRDIVACASCHDQGPATNCIRCHRVGGPGKNPHPDGWQSARSPGDAMCRYCHE